MSDTRTEYLESIHRQFAATQQLLAGVAQVRQGGVEGLREAAQSHPEIVFECLARMGDIIEILQRDVIREVEARYDLLDRIEQRS